MTPGEKHRTPPVSERLAKGPFRPRVELTAPGMHAGASEGTESQAEQDVRA